MGPKRVDITTEVTIDPEVPIEQWGLSAAGYARAERLLPVLVGQVDRIMSSAERKATDTAAVLAAGLCVPTSVDPALGEMDRSATGYLPPSEFEAVVDLFFDEADQSVRGWERAVDAQTRIVDTIRRIPHTGHSRRTAFVSHGGVGALLLASLTGSQISRSFDQPGMGSYFSFDAHSWTALSGWNRIPLS